PELTNWRYASIMPEELTEEYENRTTADIVVTNAASEKGTARRRTGHSAGPARRDVSEAVPQSTAQSPVRSVSYETVRDQESGDLAGSSDNEHDYQALREELPSFIHRLSLIPRQIGLTTIRAGSLVGLRRSSTTKS